MMHILFVCTGNTCRSPLAEAMMKKTLMERPPLRSVVRCASAGLEAVEGATAERGAVAVAQQEDIDLSHHRAQRVDANVTAHADLILTMTSRHRDLLIERYPDCANRVYTFRAYVARSAPADRNCQQNSIVRDILTMDRTSHNLDILDPIGQSLEAYQACAQQIKAAVAALAGLLEESVENL